MGGACVSAGADVGTAAVQEITVTLAGASVVLPKAVCTLEPGFIVVVAPVGTITDVIVRCLHVWTARVVSLASL